MHATLFMSFLTQSIGVGIGLFCFMATDRRAARESAVGKLCDQVTNSGGDFKCCCRGRYNRLDHLELPKGNPEIPIGVPKVSCQTRAPWRSSGVVHAGGGVINFIGKSGSGVINIPF